MTGYWGTEGHRPYAGAAWYYAEYRDRVSPEFVERLAQHLGWRPSDRVLDLGAGPGQLSILAAPHVAEVVAIEPEPDMLAEGQRRAGRLAAGTVTFVAASAEDLRSLRPALGRFRTALMGQSFHWMVDRDRVLDDLSAMIDETDGSVAIVTPRRISTPAALEAAHKIVGEILDAYLRDVPPGPHPAGRHDPFKHILARSTFPRVETLSREYETPVRPTVEALVGPLYGTSYVLTRLGGRREAFEREVRAALGGLEESGEVRVTRRDEALIGRRARGER